MKTIGLIGGMSWESSLEYYRIINEAVKNELGGLHSAKCVLFSVDFEEIEAPMHQQDWNTIAGKISDAARTLEGAGAECLVICTNTVHKVAEEVQASVRIPLLHIVEAAARAIISKDIQKVGLLGTRFTMEEEFYRRRLKEKHNIDVIIPDKGTRETVHGFIFDELCLGVIKKSTRKFFQDTMKNLKEQGAEGIVLGCTELPLIIEKEDISLPLFDTTDLHARSAVRFALGKD